MTVVDLSPFRIIRPRSGVHYALLFPADTRVTQFFRRIIDTSVAAGLRPRSPPDAR